MSQHIGAPNKPSQQFAEVVAGGTQDRVDSVASSTDEIAAIQAMAALEMSNRGLDSRTTAEHAAQHPRRLLGDRADHMHAGRAFPSRDLDYLAPPSRPRAYVLSSVRLVRSRRPVCTRRKACPVRRARRRSNSSCWWSRHLSGSRTRNAGVLCLGPGIRLREQGHVRWCVC